MAFGTNFERKLDQLHKRAMDAVVEDLCIIPDGDLDQLIPKCQSPIERLLVEALLLNFTHRRICDLGLLIGPSTFYTCLPDQVKDARKHVGEVSFIDAQVQIEKYTADIVVCRYEFTGDAPIRTPLVVVECDGHDFHERTKEQARHDKLRDRVMQQAGYSILRFSGSEVWQDPWGCSEQINDFLNEKIRAAYEGR